jgi:hypothetical protein
MAKDVQAGNYGGAAATLAGTVGGVAAPVKAPEIAAGLTDASHAVANAPGAIADAARTGLRDETGKLKPVVKTAAAAAGAGAGGIAGHVLGVPGAGEIAGLYLGPKLADAVIPDRPASVAKAVPVSKNPTPGGYTGPASARVAAKAAESPVSSPASVADSEGRPATWTNEKVIQLSRQGDPRAIQQGRLRQLDLPDNANLVANKEAKVTPSVGAPRSVTLFDSDGNPVRSGAVDSMAGIMADKPAGNYGYRVRDVGEEGLPISGNSRAHATTTLEDAQRLAPGREDVQGKPQEIVRYDLSKLKEGTDYERVPREGQPDWIRMLRPLKESEVQPAEVQ